MNIKMEFLKNSNNPKNTVKRNKKQFSKAYKIKTLGTKFNKRHVRPIH